MAGTGDELTASVYTQPLTTDTLNSTLNASKVFSKYYLPKLVLLIPLHCLCWSVDLREGSIRVTRDTWQHVPRGCVMRDVAARHVAHVEVRQLMPYSLAFTSTATPAASTAPQQPQHRLQIFAALWTELSTFISPGVFRVLCSADALKICGYLNTSNLHTVHGVTSITASS